MSGIKVIYEDVAVGAKADSTPTSLDKRSFVNINTLKSDDNITPNYALCLPRYSKINSNFVNIPSSYEWDGYVSDSISDANGNFTNKPSITIELGDSYASVGISLLGNQHTQDYSNSVTIVWYLGANVIDTKSYSPNNHNYFCENSVQGYDKVVITFNSTSKPYRNVFISRIDFGLTRSYGNEDLTSENCRQEISPISENLAISTFGFTIKKNGDSASYMFQSKQRLRLYFDGVHLGDYYLSSGNRLSEFEYRIECKDAIGVLDGLPHYGGIYTNVAFGTLVSELIGGLFAFDISTELINVVVSGYLPIASRRENLAQAAFAVGAIVDTSNSELIRFYKAPTLTTASIPQSEIFKPQIKYEEVVTGVDITCHSYEQSTESMQVYKAVLTGTTKIKFNQPLHTLSITGGTIISSGVNFAEISGTGVEVVLTGKKYNDTKTVLSYRTLYVKGVENVLKVEDATLVSISNGQSVLERVRDYYSNNSYVDADMILGTRKVGEKVNIDTGYDGVKEGIISKVSMRFGVNYIRANCEVV